MGRKIEKNTGCYRILFQLTNATLCSLEDVEKLLKPTPIIYIHINIYTIYTYPHTHIYRHKHTHIHIHSYNIRRKKSFIEEGHNLKYVFPLKRLYMKKIYICIWNYNSEFKFVFALSPMGTMRLRFSI